MPVFSSEASGSDRRYEADAAARPVICSLISHSRLAASSSCEAELEGVSLLSAKYLPVTPSTSGEEAR